MIAFNPYVALGSVALLVSSTTGAFFFGKHVAAGEQAAAQVKQLATAIDDMHDQQKRIDTLETAAQTRENDRQTDVREIYREIPKIIERPVYRNVCVDADGVGVLDRAQAVAAGHASADPGAAARPSGGAAKGPAQR